MRVTGRISRWCRERGCSLQVQDCKCNCTILVIPAASAKRSGLDLNALITAVWNSLWEDFCPFGSSRLRCVLACCMVWQETHAAGNWVLSKDLDSGDTSWSCKVFISVPWKVFDLPFKSRDFLSDVFCSLMVWSLSNVLCSPAGVCLSNTVSPYFGILSKKDVAMLLREQTYAVTQPEQQRTHPTLPILD